MLSRYITARSIIFSLNSFVAAMGAVYISLYCDLERAYWAMMTAYITSQLYSSAVRSKAVYRMIGTIVGACFAVFIVPVFSNAPILLSGIVSLWIGLCLGISLLDRTPRSYVTLLMGYTTALIVFPIVNVPQTVFQTAISRFEEIGVGVLCAMIVHSVVFPQSIRAPITDQLNKTADDLKKWVATALSPGTTPAQYQQHQLAMDMTEIQLVSTHLQFDTHEPKRSILLLRAIQNRLVYLFPLVNAVSERLRSLETMDGSTPALQTVLNDINTWLANPDYAPTVQTQTLLDTCKRSLKSAQAPSWKDLLAYNTLTRLIDMITNLRDCFDYISSFNHNTPLTNEQNNFLESASERPLHTDYAHAVTSGIIVGGVLFIGCLLWIGTGWPEGGTALMMASIIACLFASLPNPVPAQKSFLFYTTLSTLFAGLYLFLLLPMAHNFPTLALLLSVFLIPAGILMSFPLWNGKMLALIMIFSGTLTLSRTFNPDFASFANNSCAQFIGMASIVLVLRAVHHINANKKIDQILHQTYEDIANIATETMTISEPEWVSVMVDRIGILTPHIDPDNKNELTRTNNVMRGIRTGLNIHRLAIARHLLPEEDSNHFGVILTETAQYFKSLCTDDQLALPQNLRASLDEEIGGFNLELIDKPAYNEAIHALIGLRSNLFAQL